MKFLNAKIMIRCGMQVNFADFFQCDVFYIIETIDENDVFVNQKIVFLL